MAAALEGAKLGSEIGRFAGPEGGVAGAILGGIIGAAGIAGNLIQRNEPSTTSERQPLIRANPLSGRTVPQLRQRVVNTVPGRDTQDIADQAIRQAAERSRQNEIRQRVRPRIIQTRHIPRVVAATGATAASIAASQIPDATRVSPPVVSRPAPPPQTTTPTAPTNPIPPPPIDEPPVIVDSNPESKTTPEVETKEPEIPPEVITQHLKSLERLNRPRVGNFHLPIFGRHDFVEWTGYTEGNALASQY